MIFLASTRRPIFREREREREFLVLFHGKKEILLLSFKVKMTYGAKFETFHIICVGLSTNPLCSRILLMSIAIESLQCYPKGNAYIYGLDYTDNMWKAKMNIVEMSLQRERCCL